MTDKPPFVPSEGDHLVVQLPGETLRGLVSAVPDEDTVIVELVNAPLAHKLHNFRKGSFVPVRRRFTPLGEVWVAVDEAQLRLAAVVKRTQEALKAPSPPDQVPEPAPEAKEAVKDAAVARKQPKRDQPKHPRDGAKRLPAKASGGGKPVERAPASKGKRRARG